MKPKITPTELRLDELAKSAGTSARTVRYYVQRGLLPPPVFRGKDSAYGEAHLVRLRAIQKLQSAFFPLDAIKRVLDHASDAEVTRIASGHVPGAPAQALVAPAGSSHGSHAGSPSGSHPSSHAASHAPKKVDHVGARIVERVEKIALMPGVELLVSEGAGPAARKLVERLIEHAEQASKENGK